MNGWEVGATTRSPIAFFLVPFMCVWSGGSLGGIYGGQISSGKFSLVLSLFGIPFLLGTILFGSIAVMGVCGKVVVSVVRNRARIFTSAGRLGFSHHFDWPAVASISETHISTRRSASCGFAMADGANRLIFATNLSDPRRYFPLQALRKMLAQRGR